jgi:hypothetical protein
VRRRIGIGRGLTASPRPHHRTYGSRLRRFGGFSSRWGPCWRRGTPSPSKSLPGSASASAGLRLKRHGPCADLTVFQARSRLTPRQRRSRYGRRPHGCHRSPRRRRRSQQSSALTRDGAAATPQDAYHPSSDCRRSPATRTKATPRVQDVTRRTSRVHAFRAFALPRRRFGRCPVHVQPRNVRRHGRSTALFAALTPRVRRRPKNRVTPASTRGPARALCT